MGTRVSTFLSRLCLALLSLVPAIWSGSSAAADDLYEIRQLNPKILPGFSNSERLSLTRAFGAAAKKVQGRQSCRALFEGLDLGGADSLNKTLYQPARVASDVASCERGSVALTGLGGRRTRLCSNFKLHSLRDQAGILLHEALHVAGMSEKPVDPNGLTPHEINQMVKKACGF